MLKMAFFFPLRNLIFFTLVLSLMILYRHEFTYTTRTTVLRILVVLKIGKFRGWFAPISRGRSLRALWRKMREKKKFVYEKKAIIRELEVE